MNGYAAFVRANVAALLVVALLVVAFAVLAALPVVVFVALLVLERVAV